MLCLLCAKWTNLTRDEAVCTSVYPRLSSQKII